LTASGRELMAKVQETHPAQVRALFGGLDGAELHQLDALLDKLGSHLAGLSRGLATDFPECSHSEAADQAGAPAAFSSHSLPS
jgi:hypothetical protein